MKKQNNQIQEFHSEEFGSLEILMIDDKPYFPATECAKVLGYAKPHDAVSRHCRYSVKHGVPHPQNQSKFIEVNFIPEGDLIKSDIANKRRPKNPHRKNIVEMSRSIELLMMPVKKCLKKFIYYGIIIIQTR